mmetsp:Transcript_22789/g.40341  ORF Transcript_22789/g.40341 Transcript_22789/m.40341 type:complete len:530 (+) Transcript_22789:864-2453(+)
MGFFDLVKQDHRIRAPAHSLCELAALFVADVSRRSSSHATDSEGVHVFAHIEPNHRVLGVKELLCQGLAQLGFTNAGRTEEHEVGQRAVRVRKARSRALHSLRDSLDRLFLADHALVQLVIEGKDPFHLGLEHLLNGHSRPLRNNLSNIIGLDLLSDERHVAELLLGRLQLPLEVIPHAVAEAGGLLEVVVPLGLGSSDVDVLHLLFNAVDFGSGVLFLEPFLVEPQLLFLSGRDVLLEHLDAVLARLADLLIGWPLERQKLHFVAQQSPLGLFEFQRLRSGLGLHFSRGLVDEVDRLVGEEAVGDVTVREPDSFDQRVVRNPHLVEQLVLLAKTSENRYGLFRRGFLDHDLLEPPLESCVFLHVLSIFVEGCGSDAPELTSGEHRFQQVARVHSGVPSLACSNDRVDLVDEEDDCPVFFHLVDHSLEPLFELTTVLGASDQLAKIQGVYLPSHQCGGHVAVRNALGQTFDNSSLTHTRLSDEDGVVLSPSRENLDGSADLLVSSYNRIELAVYRGLREVARVFVQRFV